MKSRFFSVGTILSFFAQMLLFSVAATALTLLYLSYRNEDFLQTFIVIGMILTLPWLTISLLPTLFALKDQELRRQLVWGQLFTMVVIFALFYGASVLMGFDTVILTTLARWFEGFLNELPRIIEQVQTVLQKVIRALVSLYDDTIGSFFP